MFALVGCGADTYDHDAGPVLDKAKKVASLTDSEVGTLCDWLVMEHGGYGNTITCGPETISVYADQAACKPRLTPVLQACPNATVGQYQACIAVTAVDPCDTSRTMSAECQTFDAACGR